MSVRLNTIKVNEYTAMFFPRCLERETPFFYSLSVSLDVVAFPK